jgi:hypothetical protein
MHTLKKSWLGALGICVLCDLSTSAGFAFAIAVLCFWMRHGIGHEFFWMVAVAWIIDALFDGLLGVMRLVKINRLKATLGPKLTVRQKRIRFALSAAPIFLEALALAWFLPYKISSGAFWCIYVVALIYILVMLELFRQEVFEPQRLVGSYERPLGARYAARS